MTDKTDYPETVTKENLQSLYEKADEIREKSLKPKYIFGFLLSYIVVAFFVIYEFFRLFVWLGIKGYFNFLSFLLKLPYEIGGTILVLLLLGFAVTCSLPIVVTWIFTLLRIQERLGYPTYVEVIFSMSFIIARHLSEDERLEATKKVGIFLAYIKGLQRDLRNSERKIYSTEFNMLGSGATQITRMLLFSTANVSDYFRDFGLAFIRNDYPKSYSNLNALIEEAEKYGELKGRVRRLLSGMERYPNSLPWISSIIILIIVVIVFLLSGHVPIVT